jgi:hypothetical protein
MLPTHKAVRDHLAQVTGRSVTLAVAAPFAPSAADHPTYGVYVDRHMHTRAVAVCDLPMAVYTGAAGHAIPVGGTEDELGHHRLTERTAHGVREMLGGLGALLETDEGPFELHAMYPPGEEPPSDLPAYACSVGRRLDLVVTIAGYRPGRLSLVLPVL